MNRTTIYGAHVKLVRTVFIHNITTIFAMLKPVVSPTYHYPTVIIQYCDIVFISQVVKFNRLSDFPRLYISHTKLLKITYAAQH
jgi:hypothetical protein